MGREKEEGKRGNMAKKIAIIGASGMLGSMVLDVFSKSKKHEIVASVRNENYIQEHKKNYPNVDWRVMDVENADVKDLRNKIGDVDYVINAIGITKPYIHDDNPDETERALKVNSLFPHRLGRAVNAQNAQILQIATDCVFSGAKGRYTENDKHDAYDVYGKTKSLGEAYLPNVHHLRCSIIGPERKGYAFLLEWFIRQPKNAKVNGFINHQWNGVTTLHFAKICMGIIEKGISLGHLQHIIPTGTISKADMLECFAKEYNRKDITINRVNAPTVIDRTLSTINEKLNKEIWHAAGYTEPPTVPQMIEELAKYKFVDEIK